MMAKIKNFIHSSMDFWGSRRYSSSNINRDSVNSIFQSESKKGLTGEVVVYKGNIHSPVLEDELVMNMDKLLNSLNTIGKGQAFCLMPVASMVGIGGVYVRNLSTLHHYIPGINANESKDYSEVVIKLLYRASLKYDVSDMVTLIIKYYPSSISKSITRRNLKDLKNKIYKKYEIFAENKEFLINMHKRFLMAGDCVELGPFKPLPKVQSRKEEHRNIIVMDLETYRDGEGSIKVYAAGYLTDEGVMKTFYITDFKDRSEMLNKFLCELMEAAGEKTTVYAHNWSKFDGVLMLNLILEWTSKNNARIEPIITATDVKVITIITKAKVIKFHDSLLMFNAGLDKISTTFNVSNLKGKFPHDFVTEDNLNYIGPKPGINFYKNISSDEYRNIPEYWNLKSQCLSYLEKDLKCLLDVVQHFRSHIMGKYQLEIGRISTMPALAFKIFRKIYYNEKEDVRIITHRVYNIIKKAFIGGRAEVYKPFGKNLLLYDINSLYPYAMTKPMPVGAPTYIGFKNTIAFEQIEDEMGFAIVDVQVPTGIRRPLLPVNVHGRNYCPTGKWTGIYFIPELKDLATRGYNFQVHGYFKFKTSDDLFKEYVKDQYHLKVTAPNKVARFTHKLMLNSLFGRFGMLDQHNITRIVPNKTFNKIIDTYNVDNFVSLKGGEKFLVSYDSSKMLNFIDENINKLTLINQGYNEKLSPNIQSIPIAAAITSYARIEMNKVLGDKQYNVYYTDTDSVVVNKPLPEEMVSSKAIGKFKLEEGNIKEGFFILPKVYCLKFKDGSSIIKHKGIKKMKELGIFEEVISGKRELFINEGEARIFKDIWRLKGLKEHKVTQRFNMKLITRKKVINKNGRWINTKPLTYKKILNNKDKIFGKG